MSEDKKDPKSNLRVLEFDKTKGERKEANEVVAKMFEKLAKRAMDGDIQDFIITFKSESRGTESMIGGTVRDFDFVGYIGMLELLKQRLIDIMSEATYAYAIDKDDKYERDEDEPTDPEKTED